MTQRECLLRPDRLMHGSGLLAAVLALGCASEEEPATEAVRPVKTLVVAAGDDVRRRLFPGTVEASRRVELAFRVPGSLATFPVKEGQRVSKGDLIAQLRQDEFQARLTTLQGELDEARAALRALLAGERPEEIRRREAQLRAAESRLVNARSEFQRNESLFRQNALSQRDYERSETAYRVAQEEHHAAQESVEQAVSGRQEDIDAMEARVRGLEGRVVEAKIQLDDSSLRAPYDGVIAQRFVDEGQNIIANDRVVQFQDVDEIDIAADVPETVMASEIQLAEILQITAELSAARGIEFPVRLREAAQVADPVTQTFRVRVAMEAPPDLRVLPGMSATVAMVYRRASVLGQPILIPATSVGETPAGQQVVWVLNADGSVAPRPVQLGAAQGGRIEVVEGLVPGDRIVVAGVRFLREGARVRDLGDALGSGQP